MPAKTDLPPSPNNNGSVLMEKGDLGRYFLWSALVFFLMTICYLFWWTLFTKCYQLKRYHYSSLRERYMYL